jgi:hypothetical protein
MNCHSRILVACLLAALLAGCGPPRVLDDATFNAGLDPRDQRIVALVAWLKHKGVTLEYTGTAEGGGWWRLTEPKAPADYDVVFSIRSFPDWASEAQMHKALDINLAYMLNAPAHLAMSYGGTVGKHPEAKGPSADDELPKLGRLPVTKVVEQWFMEY